VIRSGSRQRSPASTPERSSTLTEPLAAVRLAEVTRTFGGLRALDGVDCSLERATLVAIVGANGSGKSTLLRLVAGAIAPTSGTVEVFGLDPRADASALRSRVGYAGQDAALDGEITGHETLRLFHALRGLPRRERDDRLRHVIEEFQLAPFCERLVGGYSGGQRQRLHLALETLHAPELLLLDEPTSSLDPAGRDALWRLAAEWRAAGRAVVVATHDLADVERHCDRVVIMKDGRIVADGAPERIAAAHGIALTTIALAQQPDDPLALRDALAGALADGRVDVDRAIITIARDRALDAAEPALDRLRELGLSVTRFERTPPGLASAYHALTGAGAATHGDRRPRSGGRRWR
jgi:ABC-2 type transport system ATP-binding protein